MNYTLIKQHDKHHAHVQFNGPFMGKEIVWDTHFYTLAAYQRDHTGIHKQFILIENDTEKQKKLTVVLNVNEINHANILKMMIMIRQYKKLAVGKHEYG